MNDLEATIWGVTFEVWRSQILEEREKEPIGPAAGFPPTFVVELAASMANRQVDAFVDAQLRERGPKLLPLDGELTPLALVVWATIFVRNEKRLLSARNDQVNPTKTRLDVLREAAVLANQAVTDLRDYASNNNKGG